MFYGQLFLYSTYLYTIYHYKNPDNLHQNYSHIANNNNLILINSQKIYDYKNLLSYRNNMKFICSQYIPIIILNIIFISKLLFIITIFLQLYMSYNYHNLITIFIFFFLFHYKCHTYIYAFYLITLFIYLLYYAHFFKKISLYILQMIGLIYTFLMFFNILVNGNLHMKNILIIMLFIIYSVIFIPHSIMHNTHKMHFNLQNDYTIYYYL
jgi:hypothetical protein